MLQNDNLENGMLLFREEDDDDGWEEVEACCYCDECGEAIYGNDKCFDLPGYKGKDHYILCPDCMSYYSTTGYEIEETLNPKRRKAI